MCFKIRFNDTKTFIIDNITLVTQVCQNALPAPGSYLPLFNLDAINQIYDDILVNFFRLSSYLTIVYTAGFALAKESLKKAFQAFFLLSEKDVFIAYVVPLTHMDLVHIIDLKKCLILAVSNSSHLIISPDNYYANVSTDK